MYVPRDRRTWVTLNAQAIVMAGAQKGENAKIRTQQ